LAMVRPVIVTLVPERVWKTRWALLPLTVTLPAPGPWMVRLWATSSSPLVSAIVPVRPLAKLIVSPLAEAAIWARSEPAPLLCRLATVKVLGTVRSSRVSRAGRERDRSRRRWARERPGHRRCATRRQNHCVMGSSSEGAARAERDAKGRFRGRPGRGATRPAL